MSKIEQIDRQLKEYYASLQAPYDQLFSIYCDDNGIDEDSLADELAESADDSILVEFDPDFPFAKPPKNDSDRNQKILDLIKKCYNNKGLSFTVSLPEINEQFFEVNDNDLKEIAKLYKTQCPVLWNQGMENDATFLRILAIGRKKNVDYLQHLVDDYFVSRVKNIHRTYTEADWAKNNKHIKKIGNFKTKSAVKPDELARAAVKSFGARCCPKLLFANLIEIHNSLETTVNYIVTAATWINSLITTDNSMCPLQIDFCIAFDAPSNQEDVLSVYDDDDDDDDDELDEKAQANSDFFDIIGNIKEKLNKNKLTYEFGQNDPNNDEAFQPRMFGQIFNEFKNKVMKSNNDKTFPQKSRFIMFCDRRNDKKKKDDEKCDVNKDDIWMYEPPKNCRRIPNDAVPEWYISASRTTLLPNDDYGDGKQAEASGKKDDSEKQTKQKLLKSNIASSSHCKGSLLTLSFICKEVDAIKSYLYWNGQITRFLPEDIRDVFPKLFNMKWNNGQKLKGGKSLNEKYLESKEMNKAIKILKEKMTDKHFTCFQQNYVL